MAVEAESAKLFADLALVVFFAVAGGLLAARLRVPPVIGLLLVGALVGPNALGLVGAESVVQTFSQIGAVLLLFMIGVEFSLPKLFEAGLRPVVIAFLKMGFVFFLCYETSLLLGLEPATALYAAAIFAISSTAILSKILEQQGLKSQPIVSLLVGELVIEDVIAVFALTFFASAQVGREVALGDALASLFSALLVLAVAYFLLRWLLQHLLEILERYNPSPEFLTFTGLGACLTMSMLAGWMGLTPAIGAFLAGSLIATLPSGPRVEEAMRPFGLTFSSLFFVSIGMLVNPLTALSSLPIGLALVFVFLLSTFFAVSLLVRLLGGSPRDSIFAGASMLVVGEFSLLIAQAGAPVARGVDLVGLASLAVIVTSFACSFSLERHHSLYLLIDRLLPRSIHRWVQGASHYLAAVIAEFERGGEFHRVLRRQVRTVRLELAFLAILLLGFLFLNALLGSSSLNLLGMHLNLVLVVGLLLLLLALYPLWRVGKASESVLEALGTALLRFGLVRDERGRLAADLLLALLLLLTGFNLPILFVLFRLPPAASIFSYGFLLSGLLFALDAGRLLYRYGHVPRMWR